ncbi:Peptidoglycan hydrolase FlgJ [compost metagenome]
MSSFKEEFYRKYAPLAQAEEARGGLPASVTLAQAYIEGTSSASGTRTLSKLASKWNAFFGIKAGSSWNGKTAVMASPEEVNGSMKMQVSTFRAYDSAAQSFADHTDFLKKNPTYTKNGVFATKDPFAVASALQKAGYATNSNYANDIMREIKDYNLTAYDNKKSSVTDSTFGNGSGTNGPLITGPITVDPNAPFTPYNPNSASLMDPTTWLPALGDALKNFAVNATTIIIIILLALIALFLIYKMVLPDGVGVSVGGVKV